MKNIFIIPIILSIVLSSLSAKDIYIKVNSVQNQGLLFNLTYELQEYGYKVLTKKKNDWYTVYTGPFKSSAKVDKALKHIRKSISKSASISTLTVKKKEKKVVAKKEKVVPIAPVKLEVEPKEDPYKDTRFFIGVNLGLSMFNVVENDIDGTVVLDNNPRDAGYTYGLEAGYYFNNDIFVTMNIQRTDLENLYFDNVFVTLNYQFNNLKVALPYIGAIGGYNIMNWINYPVETTLSQENSSSFFVGFQLGNDMPITKELTASIFYRYMLINNTTEITVNPSTKEIEHKSEQNINIGLKYNF